MKKDFDKITKKLFKVVNECEEVYNILEKSKYKKELFERLEIDPNLRALIFELKKWETKIILLKEDSR